MDGAFRAEAEAVAKIAAKDQRDAFILEGIARIALTMTAQSPSLKSTTLNGASGVLALWGYPCMVYERDQITFGPPTRL